MKKKLKQALMILLLFLGGTQAMNAQSYCATGGKTIFGLGLWINRFELGSINNNSGNNNGYADFTSQSASLQAGSGNSFTADRGGNLFSNKR